MIFWFVTDVVLLIFKIFGFLLLCGDITNRRRIRAFFGVFRHSFCFCFKSWSNNFGKRILIKILLFQIMLKIYKQLTFISLSAISFPSIFGKLFIVDKSFISDLKEDKYYLEVNHKYEVKQKKIFSVCIVSDFS